MTPSSKEVKLPSFQELTHAAKIDKRDQSTLSTNYAFPGGNNKILHSAVQNQSSIFQTPTNIMMSSSGAVNAKNGHNQPRLSVGQQLLPPPSFQQYQPVMQQQQQPFQRQASTSSPALYQNSQAVNNPSQQQQQFVTPQRQSATITAPTLPSNPTPTYTHISTMSNPSISGSARSSAVASSTGSSMYNGKPSLLPPPVYSTANQTFTNQPVYIDPVHLFKQIEQSILASIESSHQTNIIAEYLSSLVSEASTPGQQVIYLSTPRNKFSITQQRLMTFLMNMSAAELDKIIDSTRSVQDTMLAWKHWLLEQQQQQRQQAPGVSVVQDTSKSSRIADFHENMRMPKFDGRRMSQATNMSNEVSPTHIITTSNIRSSGDQGTRPQEERESINTSMFPFSHFDSVTKTQKQIKMRRKSTDDSFRLKRKSRVAKVAKGSRSHFKSNSSETNNLIIEEEENSDDEEDEDDDKSLNARSRVSTTGEHISFRVKPQTLTEKGVKVAEQIRPPKRGAQGQLHPELSAKKDLFCSQCGTKDTPEWRKGPLGARTLCNACGLYLAKLYKKMDQEEADEFFLSKRDEKFKKN